MTIAVALVSMATLAGNGPAPGTEFLLPRRERSPAIRAAMRFEIASKPYVDLWFHVRTLASSTEPLPPGSWLAEAVDAARSLDAELKSPLAWGYVEGLIGDCATAKEGSAALAEARETVEMPGGKSVRLRAGALKLASALEKIEPRFLESLWPPDSRAIQEATERIAKGFAGKEGECLAFVAKHLGLVSDDRAIPVRLVFEAPFPGAVTHRTRGGTTVSFVGVKDFPGTQLLESVLHEATHALDVATTPPQVEDKAAESKRAPSVLDELRSRLEKAGFTRRDREWRDVPHTLMFVQAGETIRRIVDPKHEHYGVAGRYYDKVKPIADVELAAWTAYLDGKTTREEAIERIVAAVAGGKSPR